MEKDRRSTDQPLISIITVTYNAANHLQQCIDSVQDQKYPCIEHVIIDGASSDGTINILEKNSISLSFWKSEPDDGIFNAMNKGLARVKGDWIYFLGADDRLYPEFSEMAAKLTDQNTIYYGQCTWGNMMLGGEFTPYRLTKDCICHHSVFYPKSVFAKYKYSEKYPTGGDHLLNIQCWTDRSFKKEYHPFTVADFAQNGRSQTTPDPLFDADFPAIIKKYCSIDVYLRYRWRKLKKRL